LSQNLSQLIKSTRGTFIPSSVKIRSRGTSGQIGEMSLSCDFIYLFWNGYGVCSNLASSGEPPPLLHKTTLTTDAASINHYSYPALLSRCLIFL